MIVINIGAEEGTRTPTSYCSLDPEPSASTNSATSAHAIEEKKHRFRVKKKVNTIHIECYLSFK